MTSPSSNTCSFLFFFKLRLGSKPTVVVGRGEERGRVKVSYDLRASLDDDPLFRPAIRSLKPFLEFRDIGSSFLELLSTLAIINLGGSELLRICQTHPQNLGSQRDLLAPLLLPLVGIDQFPPRVISTRKRSLPSGLLLRG